MPEASSPTSVFNGTWSATALTMVVCGTIAGYNAIEGLVLILTTFKHYEGLYFWSLIVADLGILIYMVFVTLWYFALTVRLAALLPLYVGWVFMVTGQSVVLYSRLGIVLGPNRANILRMAKWMIIIDAIVFHTSTITIALCSFYAPNPKPASRAYYYMERLHITAFGLQELILSALYIWTAVDILRTSLQPNVRRIVIELIAINFILVAIDIAGITLEYCNLFFFEVAFKMASYSIKLKLEFAILSKLMALSGGDNEARESRSRGDSLVFPMDTVSTAIEKGMYASTNAPPTNQRSFVNDATATEATTIRRHHSSSGHSGKVTSDHLEDIESFDNFVRRMSRGGSI